MVTDSPGAFCAIPRLRQALPGDGTWRRGAPRLPAERGWAGAADTSRPGAPCSGVTVCAGKDPEDRNDLDITVSDLICKYVF